MYTTDRAGSVYFDADLKGHPGQEKITVCDNKSDGYSVTATVWSETDGDKGYKLTDPSHDGHCKSLPGNLFKEGRKIHVQVVKIKNDVAQWSTYAEGTAVA
ncbi:hypothetical protein ABT174_02290 [Streptomyces sparsogenes]|uniref:hypothetical protein n=1 Tax=Streptomyces sparsogenes TaxID=67365 RepID=UPI00331B3407